MTTASVVADVSVLKKRCGVCQLEWTIECFRGRRRVCRMCEQTLRDRRKAQDRWPSKIRWTTSWHARQFGVAPRVLRHYYGWTPETLRRDGRQVEMSCPDCGRSVHELLNGLFDIVLQILNPNEAPAYPNNVRWVCRSCAGSRPRSRARWRPTVAWRRPQHGKGHDCFREGVSVTQAWTPKTVAHELRIALARLRAHRALHEWAETDDLERALERDLARVLEGRVGESALADLGRRFERVRLTYEEEITRLEAECDEKIARVKAEYVAAGGDLDVFNDLVGIQPPPKVM